MILVTLYRKPESQEADQVAADLAALNEEFPHHVLTVDITREPVLQETYHHAVPMVEIGPYRLKWPITSQELVVAFGAAKDRLTRLETQNEAQKANIRLPKMTGSDRFSLWFSKNYMLFMILFLGLYTGLPFLAPTLMKIGAKGPAQVIYTIYSPLCHQFAFRSFFLFGEQPYYPRELAGMKNVVTYEELAGESTVDLWNARRFVGNERLGYKVALCQRDVAIYGAMVVFAVLFAITGRKIKVIPWLVWVIIGLGPIGLDGLSQLPGLTEIQLPFNLNIFRESTPFLRTFTGVLFGLTTAWYIFPMIEDAMRETYRMMLRKQAVWEQIEPQIKAQAHEIS